MILFIGIFVGQTQVIEIRHNNILIPGDGSNIPKLEDGTLYADTEVNRSRAQVFSIFNNGNKDVEINKISLSSNQFVIEENLGKIKKNSFKNINLYFEPTSTGEKLAVVNFTFKKGNNKTNYEFNLKGNGVEMNESSGIMITQYYENINNDYIEIKNFSGDEINDKEFYVALFKKRDDLLKAPKKGNTIDINKMLPDEVKVYDQLKFQGDDLIIISTSKGKDCFKDRVDIIGEQGVIWGRDISYSKGACASETSHLEFVYDNWIALDLAEVDEALQSQNLFMGTYQKGEIIWDGLNWTSNALPDRTRAARIDGLYSSEFLGNIEVCDLYVNATLDFDNNGKKSVVVNRNLSINENGEFQIGDKESLVMYDDTAQITGVINKIEKSTPLNNPYDFTYWSSPVSEARVEDVFFGVRAGRTYYFDQSRSSASSPENDPEGTYWDVWVPANGIMKPGRGYASEASEEIISIHQINFNGRPNNGVIYEEIHFNDDLDDFNDYNLIGNPYPSAIDIDMFFDENDGVIDPTIYLWTHSTPASEQTGDYSPNDYATYNKTGGTGVGNGPIPLKNIGSAQGFQVRALKEDRVVFKNSMRIIDSNDQFFKRPIAKKEKEEEKDRIWVDLLTDQGGFNQLLIGFVEGASSKFDAGYDALKNHGSNKISFYSLLERNKLAIQGLGLFKSKAEILLGFDTKVDNRKYTISVSKVEGKLRDAEVVLHDHVLNLNHDLRKSNYTFEQVEQGSYQDRFSLRFIQKATRPIEVISKKNGLIVYNQGHIFKVKASSKVERIRIYDILGNIIIEKHPGNKSFELIEPSSKRGDVLLMQIVYSDQSNLLKKIYKQ